MRYFKYSGEIPDLETIQKNSKLRSRAVQRQQRRARILHKLGTVVFWAVFLMMAAGLIILALWLLPEEDGVFFSIANFIIRGLLCSAALIVAAIAGAAAAAPLWGKHHNAEKALLRDALNESCAALRQFYQFKEPFLVTKCYRSSDKRFDRHDVCLFIVEDELRITANLHYGFFDPHRDLGCYCLTRPEICLTKMLHKDRPAVELQADGVSFVLGQKAEAYVETFLGALPQILLP